MMRALLLLTLLTGCDRFRGPPIVLPFVAGCGTFAALAQAVVDGRKRGQSRAEQRLMVLRFEPHAPIHRALVESIYDWPRPTTARDWDVLSTTSAIAAQDRCLNRPAATLRGQVIP